MTLLAIETDEALLGGVRPEFVVDVSAAGTSYTRRGVRSSLDELLLALHEAATSTSSAGPLAAVTAVAAAAALAIEPWLLVAVGGGGIALLARSVRQAAQRRRVAIVFRLDAARQAAFESLANGVGWLASSASLWRITHQQPATRPANTSTVVRAGAQAARGEVANVVTNVALPFIASAGETLIFLPDALVIRDSTGRAVDVPYTTVKVDCDTMQFTDSGPVPGDCRRVGSAWLYANKDGSPDRRRANNRQLPVLEYARIVLSWPDSGCVLLVSNVEAARRFANSLLAFAQPPVPKPAPSVVRPLAIHAPPLANPAPAPKPVVTSAPARVQTATLPSTPAPVQPAVITIPPAPVPPRAEPQRSVVPAESEGRTRQELVGSLELVLQASLDRKRRLDELERRAAAVVSGVETPSPVAVPAPRSEPLPRGEWIAPGGSATVHGYATGDLVYVGRRLAALNGYDEDDVEPALIDPSLPIDPHHANTAGSGIDYWPSYSGISAASRTAYLQWLAGGRKDPHVAIGYLFIFFYGLERRAYELIRGHAAQGDEWLAIAREVARLLDLHRGRSRSFASHAESFLDLIASVEPRARDLGQVVIEPGFGVPLRMKIALAQLSLAGAPIPADLALGWVQSGWYPTTPATRCAREFELLFHVRYAKKFGEGLVVKPNKTFIDFAYQPASSGLDAIRAPKQRELPDITQLARPLAKLIELAQECAGALDAFSRFLGKNPDGRGSLAALGLLPDELVEAAPSDDAQALASLVASRLDSDGRAHLAAGELLSYVRLAKPGKVAKNEAVLLAQALEKLGYGIEPDVRLGGPVFDLEGPVVVFRRFPDCPSTATDEYTAATLCIRLGAAVSAADDEVSERERALLQTHIEETLQLSPGERQRLAAHLAWLLEAKPGIQRLKKELAALTSSARHHIGELLITIATTDGHVDAREMKMLEKLYDLIGLAAGDLYADIHAALAGDDEPIVVDQPASPPRGFPIPPKPAPATTATGIDMDRVRLKIAETREVSSLLSSIFVDEEVTATVSPAVAQANTIGPLDAAHSELLRRLGQRESWPRDEIERLAAELSLLTDGALETINDYAYTTLDEPFWEDGDPVVINSNVAMELIR